MGRQVPAGGRDAAGDPGDERLHALLSAGLSEQADRPVDVGGLLDGARTGARRIRRRRRAAGVTALAVVVVSLPVALTGTGLLGRQASGLAGGFGGPTTSLSATSDVAQPVPSFAASAQPVPSDTVAGSVPGQPRVGATAPEGTKVSGTTGAVLAQDAAGQYTIGTQALLNGGDLDPIGSPPQTDDDASFTGTGPTATQVCRTMPSASSRAVSGRSATYSATGDDGWTVRAVVRVLAGPAASEEMDWLKRSLGNCASDLRLRRAAVTGLPGEGAVLGYQVGADPRHPKSVLVIGVVQDGRTTSAVELVVPVGAGADGTSRIAAGVEQAKRLLIVADRRLRSSGLVAAAKADPSLAG